jgi:stress-induced morphogen
MPVSKDYLDQLLHKYFKDKASWEVIDLVGDQDHYELNITSSLFNKLTLIKQHQMVNEALKECLGTKLHALKINTKPETNKD